MRAVGEARRSARRAARRAGSRRRRRGSSRASRTASRRRAARARARARRAAGPSGRAISARAIASCCCWPPESVPASAVRELADDREQARDPLAVRGGAVASQRRAERPRRRFSSTVSEAKMWRPSGTRPMPARARSSGCPRRRSPRRRISPRASGTRPMIACSVVDLPAPLGPIRPTISPRPSVRLRPRTAGSAAVADLDLVAARAPARRSAIAVRGARRRGRRSRRRGCARISAGVPCGERRRRGRARGCGRRRP